MNYLILKLTESKFIKIVPVYDVDIKKLKLSDPVKVYFVDIDNEFQITEDYIEKILETFIKTLKKIVDRKFYLHESLTENLGFMCNEYYYKYPENPEFFMIPFQDTDSFYWVGLDYNIWGLGGSADPYISTWLYNRNDDVIFEITKLYKWAFFEKAERPVDIMEYDEFMKDYQSIVYQVISYNLAIDWLKEAEGWWKDFSKNEKKDIKRKESQKNSDKIQQLLFHLSDKEYIKVIPAFYNEELNIKHMYSCDDVKIYFEDSQKSLLIEEEWAGGFLREWIPHFTKAIEGKLQLHESLTQGLGFMLNEYYHDYPHDKSEFFKVPSENGETTYWVGLDYKLASITGNADPFNATWLYNDQNNNIIFEITQLYRWSFREDDVEDPNFMSYEDFMKDFKPLIRMCISRDVIVKLLKLAEKWRKIFSKNEKYCRRQTFILKNG